MISSFLFIFFNQSFAQKGKYGATQQDSVECVKNMNFYQEEYNKDNYDAALPLWSEALRICPKASINFYIRGRTIMRHRIDKLKDPAQKKAAIDSLLMLYDMRLEHFGNTIKNKNDVLYRKANDVEEYYPEDHEQIFKAYMAAIDINKKHAELTAAAKAMVQAQKMYETQKIDAEKFADTYTVLSDFVDERIKVINSAATVDTVALADARTCKAAIENAFMSTDAANCDNLIAMFTPRFENNKDDIATVGMIVNILLKRECTGNDLFAHAAEAYYKLDPSPKSASTLATMFYQKGEMSKAIQYSKDAIDGQTDPIDKSNYLLTLANIYLQQGQLGSAASTANQAISANSRNGRAYFMLAAIYAGTKSCGDDPVSVRSVFWVAVDMLQRARQVDNDPAFVAEVNKQINLYSQHFPSYDDCFDRDILDGQTYTVNCGPINAKTIVRTRK